MNHKDFLVAEGATIRLADMDADFTGNFANKEAALADLEQSKAKIAELQNIMYAQNVHALLVVFQAMDASGKDSTIKHVFSNVNPQGCYVAAFKQPSSEELEHDFLWRTSKQLPERGKIGIFSRSHYEEVLVVRVHPEILQSQPIPENEKRDPKIWENRFEDIRNFERYLARNGTHVLKFFLNISKDEQKTQLMERIEDPSKHWKFAFGDMKERALWDKYMHAYEEMFAATSTPEAPWYVIPGNKRWFTRATIARIVAEKLESLNLRFPEVTEKQRQEIAEAKRILENE
ncbi:MAG TPA: polyphosphate kinase 2 family protein [Pyrinomonadaceae bacterium]|nr:polyphosphate kinase 2 family protein [Pyrinomonadaceae bacterium]